MVQVRVWVVKVFEGEMGRLFNYFEYLHLIFNSSTNFQTFRLGDHPANEGILLL